MVVIKLTFFNLEEQDTGFIYEVYIGLRISDLDQIELVLNPSRMTIHQVL